MKNIGKMATFLVFFWGYGFTSLDDPNSETGVETSESSAYFKMGKLRLINNDWGSVELNCNSDYTIFINEDETFGWEFNRGSCGGNKEKPDYPEVEFGIHPFGSRTELITSPDFSSTTLLPIQIKDVNSASVTVDNLKIELYSKNSWNLNFEMWTSEQHPVTGNHNTAYAELILFFGWEDGRWACDQNGSLRTAGKSYQLCHQSDNWGPGPWRYHQFRMDGGPATSFNGTVNIKEVLDWLTSSGGYSRDLWISRFEIGSEIDDNTSGKVTMNNVTFEVNGESRSAEFFDPTDVKQTLPKEHNFRIFPARTEVAAVNLKGVKTILKTGANPTNAVELGKELPAGVYYMSAVGETLNSKKSVVVAVIK